MSKLETFIYVFAATIVVVIVSGTAFAAELMNIVGAISGALSLVGVLACAASLLWRRIRIRQNRKLFGGKAEVLERSVPETVVYVSKGIAGLWVLFVVIGFIELLQQRL